MIGVETPHVFHQVLATHGVSLPRRESLRVLQINVGKLCNQACQHCHVDAGPGRKEIMDLTTAKRLVELLERSPGIQMVDVTGGAPELCPSFRHLVASVRELGREVTVRCNLTVLHEPGMEWLPAFYKEIGARLVCSLPCYKAENVDRQRGQGVFEKSIAALRLLNELGFARSGSPLVLDLVYNPLGASLPPPQAELESTYRNVLRTSFGIEFSRLLTMANMPIRRFARFLHRSGNYDSYMDLLVDRFNPRTVAGLMCRSLISVGWDGSLYDCDFNQMLAVPAGGGPAPSTIFDISSFDEFAKAPIATRSHCFGCTAGAGSSCGGSLET